jgi:hypothetical protein
MIFRKKKPLKSPQKQLQQSHSRKNPKNRTARTVTDRHGQNPR